MSKQNITEEMKVHEQWYEESKKQTPETIASFIERLITNYNHDYGTICHAMAAAAIGAMYAINKSEQGGITGFQAGAIMWEFIRHWNYDHNKTGLRLVNYDNLLYPQYAIDFEKRISKSTWEALQREASKNLFENKHANLEVIEHWKSIVNGVLPFGYAVYDN